MQYDALALLWSRRVNSPNMGDKDVARDIHEQIVSLRASLTDDARIIDSFRLSMLHLSWRGQHLEALALLPALQAALANRKNPDRTLLSLYPSASIDPALSAVLVGATNAATIGDLKKSRKLWKQCEAMCAHSVKDVRSRLYFFGHSMWCLFLLRDHMRISTLCAEGVALLEAHPEAAPAYWTQLLHFGLKLGQFLSLEQRHKMSRTMYGAGDMSVELLDHMLSLQRSLSETKHWPTVAAILALVLLPRQLRLTECIDLCKCLQGQLSSPSRGHQQQLLPVMLGRLLCTWCEVEILAQCVRDQQPSSAWAWNTCFCDVAALLGESADSAFPGMAHAAAAVMCLLWCAYNLLFRQAEDGSPLVSF